MHKISDNSLWNEIQKGNTSAFRLLFEEYYVMLCYEAKEYVMEKCIAEEIVSDVFRKIWETRTLLTFTSPVSLRWYLIKSVRNNCISYLRANNLFTYTDGINEAVNLLSLDESPLDYILSKELELKISRAIGSLPNQYRKAFVLSRQQNKTYDEIAEEMNISVNTVKLYLKKSLSKLRQDLKDYLI